MSVRKPIIFGNGKPLSEFEEEVAAIQAAVDALEEATGQPEIEITFAHVALWSDLKERLDKFRAEYESERALLQGSHREHPPAGHSPEAIAALGIK